MGMMVGRIDVYGHGGSQSSIGFVDASNKLAACIFCNARPGPQKHNLRMEQLCMALYQDIANLREQQAIAAAVDAVDAVEAVDTALAGRSPSALLPPFDAGNAACTDALHTAS